MQYKDTGWKELKLMILGMLEIPVNYLMGNIDQSLIPALKELKFLKY